MFFDEIIKELEEKKKRREQGLYNGIPIHFKRYSEYFPSIDKGSYIGLLAATGIGKSKFIRDFALYNPFEFALKSNYKLKILYFALEDSKSLVYKHMIRHYLWSNHNIILPAKYLESKDIPLSDEYLNIIKKDKTFYSTLEENVFIVNDASTPNQIEEVCHKFHAKYGEDNHLIVIIDNFSNITVDYKEESEWQAVRRLSRNIIRLDLCKKKNMTVFGVLQTDYDTEKGAYKGVGKSAISALEPNLGSVAEVKTISRDMFEVFALFNPWRYEIKQYMSTNGQDGYNIDLLRNRFRSLLHLKSSTGETAPRLGLYFDGLKETYEEMPQLIDKQGLDILYQNVMKIENERKNFGNSIIFP